MALIADVDGELGAGTAFEASTFAEVDAFDALDD